MQEEKDVGQEEVSVGQSDKVVVQEDKVVGQEEASVDQGNKVVGQEDKVVGQEDKVVGQEDKVVGQEDKVVGQEEASVDQGEKVVSVEVKEVDQEEYQLVTSDEMKKPESDRISGFVNVGEILRKDTVEYEEVTYDNSNKINEIDEFNHHNLEMEKIENIAMQASVVREDEIAKRLEAERLEAERLEAERLEAERLDAKIQEAERLGVEKLEAKRLEAERLEAVRLEAVRIKAERLEAERLDAVRIETEKLETERLLAARREAEIEAKKAAEEIENIKIAEEAVRTSLKQEENKKFFYSDTTKDDAITIEFARMGGAEEIEETKMKKVASAIRQTLEDEATLFEERKMLRSESPVLTVLKPSESRPRNEIPRNEEIQYEKTRISISAIVSFALSLFTFATLVMFVIDVNSQINVDSEQKTYLAVLPLFFAIASFMAASISYFRNKDIQKLSKLAVIVSSAILCLLSLALSLVLITSVLK